MFELILMPTPTFKRNEHGIPHIEAADDSTLFFGQGMAHATDRALQMLLMRIVGQGRVSEILDSSDYRIDTEFRGDRQTNSAGTSLH